MAERTARLDPDNMTPDLKEMVWILAQNAKDGFKRSGKTDGTTYKKLYVLKGATRWSHSQLQRLRDRLTHEAQPYLNQLTEELGVLRMAATNMPLPPLPRVEPACDEVLAEQYEARKAEYTEVREQVLSMPPPTSLRIGDSVSAAFDEYMMWEGTVSKARHPRMNQTSTA